MENLIATILLTAAFYLWLFAPRHKSTPTDPADPIDYFPEEAAIADPQPQTITEPLPVANFKTPKPNPVKITPETSANDLHSLSIRQLKKMASAAKIKRYSTKTKAELIACLS